MIQLPFFSNKNVLVLGLGKSGKSIIKALQNTNANIYAYDDSFHELGKEACEHFSMNMDFSKLDAVIVSPGVPILWPKMHDIIKLARTNFIPILSDLDIFVRAVGSKDIIAITGTNGKSTTTALVHHILLKSGINAEIGGNFGQPLLGLNNDADVYVLELSSYQLELCNNIKFTSAAILNIMPDHLLRHGGMPGYIYAKQKVFSDHNTHCVVGIDDSYAKNIIEFLSNRKVIQISGITVPQNGIGWREGNLFDGSEFITKNFEHLDGDHNRQNIAAAYALLRPFKISADKFEEAINTFSGLEHRQELFKYKNILYVNDSKATNADATESAIKRFKELDIIWIVGGLPKEGGINSLKKYFRYIKKTFLIGKSSNDFADLLHKNGVIYEETEVIENAITAAQLEAQKYNNPVILFSPACASFDQFKNFEERGKRFKALVTEITNGEIKWL